VATFEVFPEVVLQPVKRSRDRQGDGGGHRGDVDAMIERLRKQQTQYIAATRAAAAGDKVTIDFKGAIDGCRSTAERRERAIVVGEGRMLAQLEQGLIGASSGDTREIGVDFPSDTAPSSSPASTRSSRSTSERGGALPAGVDEEFCALFGVTEGGVRSCARTWPPTCGASSTRHAQPQQDPSPGKALPGKSRGGANSLSSRRSGTCRSTSCAARRQGCVAGAAREPFVEPARAGWRSDS